MLYAARGKLGKRSVSLNLDINIFKTATPCFLMKFIVFSETQWLYAIFMKSSHNYTSGS